MHREFSYDQALAEPGLSYGTRMALYTYLIDTSQGGLGPIIYQPEKCLQLAASWVRVRIYELWRHYRNSPWRSRFI